MTIIILIAVIGGIIYWIISIYNRAIAMIEAINNNQKQIDIQLDRRFKVFQSLIEIVKKYMDYERSTLKEVVALRTQAQAAYDDGDQATRIAAENKISKIVSGINVVFEQYPDLKANQNALQLQEEVVNTENKLTFAKQAFNDSIERFYAFKKRFLESLIIAMFADKLDKVFEYWGLASEDVKAKEDYTVKL